MLSKEAIQHLEQTQLLENVATAISDAQTLSPLVALPAGVTITDLEPYMKYRTSYRCAFNTSVMSEFVQYFSDHSTIGCSKVFIDPDQMTAKAVLDMGTEMEPGHQRHTATLNPKQLPAFKELLRVAGRRMNQREICDFIEDWEPHVNAYDNSDTAIPIHNACARLRSLTVDQVKSVKTEVEHFSESMSAFEKVEAQSKETLPHHILFGCTPYDGLDVRYFKIQLSLSVTDDKPMIRLRAVRLENELDAIAEEFKDEIQNRLPDPEAIYIGTCG